ncbi:hypothetical protein LX87_03794 [Larkinella arboricola]|uniref:Uncharacterized protein n=1 Tax=Larkinella arboricola TaxID=643671 RepID=A0A327WUM0_LARAB|nr:hypothetical protein [Larkinella arboricola]RAJ96044.1 hypothetical protein LX87_03794 [Larkinella arboricola]
MKKRFIALAGMVGFMGLWGEGGLPVHAQPELAMVTKNRSAAPQKLVFDRILVYEQTDYNGSVVRYQVLLNSKTGQFGFDRKLANLSFPGVVGGYTFVTGQPDGSYRVYVADKYEGKVIMQYHVGKSFYSPNRAEACHNRFNQRYRATGREGTQYGLTATEYRASLGPKDTEWLWVAEVPFNSYPLYLFNELALEAKLPDAHSINFSSSLGPNELLVQSKKEYYSEKVNGRPATSTLKLIHFGPTNYSFDVTGYRFK